MKNRRWYDDDAAVRLAVTLLEQAKEDVKVFCSNYIIQKAKNLGIRNEDDINTSFNFVWQRKTDSLSSFHNALEYMKKMDLTSRHEVALNILKYLKEHEINDLK